MVNESLIRKVIHRISEDLDRWNQDWWAGVEDAWTIPSSLDHLPQEDVQLPGSSEVSVRILNSFEAQNICGTSFCFAGHTVIEAGDVLLLHLDTDEATFCRTPDGMVVSIGLRASELLGLNGEQSALLFGASAGDDGFDKYKEIVTKVTGVEL